MRRIVTLDLADATYTVASDIVATRRNHYHTAIRALKGPAIFTRPLRGYYFPSRPAI